MDSPQKQDPAHLFLIKHLDLIKHTSELINIRCTNLKTKKVTDKKFTNQNDVLKVVQKINLLCDLASGKLKTIQTDVNNDYQKWLKTNSVTSIQEMGTNDNFIDTDLSRPQGNCKENSVTNCQNETDKDTNILHTADSKTSSLPNDLEITLSVISTVALDSGNDKNGSDGDGTRPNETENQTNDATIDSSKIQQKETTIVTNTINNQDLEDIEKSNADKEDKLNTLTNKTNVLEDGDSSSDEANNSSSSNKENISRSKSENEDHTKEVENVDTVNVKIENDFPKIMLKCVDINKLIDPNLKNNDDTIIVLSDTEPTEKTVISKPSILKRSLTSKNTKMELELVRKLKDKKFFQIARVPVIPYNKRLPKLMKKHKIQCIYDQSGKKIMQLPKANIKFESSDDEQITRRSLRQRKTTNNRKSKISREKSQSDSESDTEKNLSILKSSLKNGNRSLNDSKNLKVTFAESPLDTDTESDDNEPLKTMLKTKNKDKTTSKNSSSSDEDKSTKTDKNEVSEFSKEADPLKKKLLEISSDDGEKSAQEKNSGSDDDKNRQVKRKSRSERNKATKLRGSDSESKSCNSSCIEKSSDSVDLLLEKTSSENTDCEKSSNKEQVVENKEKSSDSDSSVKKIPKNKMEETNSKQASTISDDEAKVNSLTNLSTVEINKKKSKTTKGEKKSERKNEKNSKKSEKIDEEGSSKESSSDDTSNNDNEMLSNLNDPVEDMEKRINEVHAENLLKTSCDESNSSENENKKKSKISSAEQQLEKSDKEKSSHDNSNNDNEVSCSVNGVVDDIENNSVASDDQNEGEKDKSKDIENKKSTEKRKKGSISDDDEEEKNKKKWKKDKLLTAKLSDTDTSDEERCWEKRKDKSSTKDVPDYVNINRMGPNKRPKKNILASDDSDNNKEDSANESDIPKDDEPTVVRASSDSDSDVFQPKTNKRKAKPKNSEASSNDSDDSIIAKKKKKLKRIKTVKSDSSDENEGSPNKNRKKIRAILKDDHLEDATKQAAREERERKQRIEDRQKLYNDMFDVKTLESTKVDHLVLDFDPDTKKELITVHKKIATKLKPHQATGIKFMYDACFESVKQIDKSKGSGCILAHCMGLGKTLQVVALIHTLITHIELTKVKCVLVVCPVSTVLNWVNEFQIWLKNVNDGEDVNVYEISRYKQNYERAYQLKDWQECGGVMVLGYDMFRNLSNEKNKKITKRRKMKDELQSCLVDPGPDLVVCDEGHLLKNEKTHISQAMNRIRTLRRIVLTGTPVQNNLKEYYCMVQFVKPNLLGKYTEYMNRFVNPITNGQYTDSTPRDISVMKKRSHVLHKMLDGCVQRRDYSVLAPFLPPKHEYVLFINLTKIQIKLYQFYLDNLSRQQPPGEERKTSFLFSDFQNFQRIWTHPRVLRARSDKYELAQVKKRDEASDSEGSLCDFIDDDDSEEESLNSTSNNSSSGSEDDQSRKKKGAGKSKTRNTRSTRGNPTINLDEEPAKPEKMENPTEWWMRMCPEEELDNVAHSAKLLLLFDILKECEAIGDKVLVFSQSLYSLDVIQHFLTKIDEATQSNNVGDAGLVAGHTGSWALGLDYFRLDGSSSCENRAIWCKSFNNPENTRARLFLISTRAGGLGINLFAANRVIIFDVSWNPSHDVQSIFRVYRFGQNKPCYVYRFIANGTMEEKIYERQVTKQAISKRVIDEQQIDRHYNQNDLQELYVFEAQPSEPRPIPLLPKDRLFADLLKKHEDLIYKYHEHDSLLENKEEETLDESERRAAWEEYENEKTAPPPPPAGMSFGVTGPGTSSTLFGLRTDVVLNLLTIQLKKQYPGFDDRHIQKLIPFSLNKMMTDAAKGDYTMVNGMSNTLAELQAPFVHRQINMPSSSSAPYNSYNAPLLNPLAALHKASTNTVGGMTPSWLQQQQLQHQLVQQQARHQMNYTQQIHASQTANMAPASSSLLKRPRDKPKLTEYVDLDSD